MRKKILSLALALAMCLGLTIPAFAEETWTESYEGINMEAFLDGTIFYFNITKSEEYTGSGELDSDYVVGFLNEACRHVIWPWLDGFWDIYGKDYAMKMSSNIVCQVNIGQGLFATDELKQDVREEIDIMSDGSWTIMFNDTATQTQPTTPTQPQQPAGTATASPTNDKLEVNGNAADPTVYKIGGSNYFKIRDVAALLNGTEKQFAVGYDGAKNAVTATTGQGYDKQSGDLAGAAKGGDQSASASNDAIYVNGEKITAEVYKIGGSNYFKLRDLGKALNFYVGWTAERGMYIETDKPYAE